MRPPPRWSGFRVSCAVINALVCHLSIVTAQAQIQGIIGPLSSPCGDKTHRVFDVCTGQTTRVLSSSMDLNAFSCQYIEASGETSTQTCPGLDVSAVAPLAPPCPYQIGTLTLSRYVQPDGDERFSLLWPQIPCATSYQVIMGVLGEPVADWCDATHPCPDGWFCARFTGMCGSAGSCQARPSGCPLYLDPVCGCNGADYGNPCEAASAGVSVACRGSCPCPPACPYEEGCLDVGPVACRLVAATFSGTPIPETPPVGQAYFYHVGAVGPFGTTTYGFTSDGTERRFEGPGCSTGGPE